MTSSINFRVRPLTDDPSHDALTELDQTRRDQIFYGDSMEKKQFVKNQQQAHVNKRAKTMKRKAEKLEQKLQEEKLERLMKRGEGSDEKPIRSEVHGKENKTLKTFMKRYQNVDDNIETDINKLCTYQLVNEGGQFRQEHPTGVNASLLTAPTYHQRFIQAKIEHIAKVTLDIRQKRAVTSMKKISHAKSIAQTSNAMYHQQVAEERVAHKRDRDEHYNAKVQIQVIRNLKVWEEDRTREERKIIEIIKKFIFDFLRLIDEYKKAQRRKDFSSDEDDDDIFHNKSQGFGFSATRNKMNATPASSTIRADSVAGRSRTSTIKGGGPLNISAGGKGNASVATPGDAEFNEEIGDSPEYKLRLKELWSKRTQLMKVKKKKKKKSRGRSALKKTGTMGTSLIETETAWDDATSAMTYGEIKQNEDFMVGLIDDTIKLQQNPRKFKASLPILETLGIDNYDAVASMDKLVFKMREALQKFQKIWCTLDKDKIYDIIRVCLARELTCVEERKDAAEYALKRPKSFDFFDDNQDLSAVKSQSFGQSSPSRMGSPSPKKTNTIRDGMKTTVRDPNNTTGFELKSLAESDGRPRPVGFKDPPAFKMGLTKKLTEAAGKNAPTAENLRRLNTKMSTGARSETGNKSARRSEVSAGRGSRFSGGDPVDPWKEHTVEQMDVLIAQITTEINKLAAKKRFLSDNPLATKQSIKAKVKPIIEEMNVLRVQLTEYEQVRDAKIPDHEKLPKDCIFYKHYLQVETNTKIEEAAKAQIKEDKELLLEIGNGLSPRKEGRNGVINPDLSIKLN